MSLPLRLMSVGVALAVAGGQASAQCLDGLRGIFHPPAGQVVPTPYCPPAPQPVPQPSPQAPAPSAETPAPQQAAPAPTEPQAPTPPEVNLADLRSGAGRGEMFALASPQMMGDFGGFCAMRTIFVPVTQTIATTVFPPPPPPTAVFLPPPLPKTTINTVTVTVPVTVCDPLTARAGDGFKIADNENPCPQDRVFFTYNYFDRLSGAGGLTPGSVSFSSTPNSFTSISTPNAVVPAPRANVNRELFGFEKTFLGGDASVEVRVPIFQTSGDDTLNGEDFGDITTIIKFALLHDPNCANCLSLGLAVTAPTGPTIATVDGTIHDVLLQPFVAGLLTSGNYFVQGFSSCVVPTDSRDVVLLFNDLGVGYTLYRGSRDRLLSYVAPAFEVHVTTPLNHRDANSPISISDIVDLEPGVYLGIGERLLLSVGVAVPVTGPRPFDVEVLAQVNFRF